VYVRLGYINIILKFSEELEPTDQIYSHIANEIHSSDVNSHIVEQTENSVIVRLDDSDLILKKYKNNTE